MTYPSGLRSHFPGRYGQCRAVGTLTPQRGFDRIGWFATGNRVPEAGPIRWGRFGYLRATIDCLRLSIKHGWRA